MASDSTARPRTRILTTSQGWIAPIASWRATPEERGGALTSFEASRIVEDLRRSSARHELALLYQVATGLELSSRPDHRDAAICAVIEEALSSGRLLLLPDGLRDARGARAAARARGENPLIKAVLGDRVELEFEGVRYRFVPVERWRERPGPPDFRPVAEFPARELVARMAERLAGTADERAAWAKLMDALTEQNRRGDGFLLIRHVPPAASAVVQRSAPAATPSQARAAVAEQAWIEIRIEYDDGTPFDASCVVELPGGRKTEGPPDAHGVVRIDGIDPGTCKLGIPELDASAWGPG